MGEGNLPEAIILKSVCKINMVKQILKLVAAVVWLVIVGRSKARQKIRDTKPHPEVNM